MFNLSPKSNYPFSNKGIQVNSLRFIPSQGNNYISIYAQYSNCKDWVPISIGLSAVPSLQQVRDIDRNISLNAGSYENAHFYLRSAEGNNVTTAFFTNKDGGGIQSGTTEGLTALNLQPLGGLLNYGDSEVASQKWTSGQGYLKIETDPVYTAAIPNILMYKGNIGNAVNLNTYATTGVYVQTSNTSAASGINYPVAFAGKLEVVNQAATFIWQIYHVYGDSNAANRGIWRREFYNGTWYAWTKLADTASGTYELLSNKVNVMTTVNSTLYPTTQAVAGKFYNGAPLTTQNQYSTINDTTAYDMSPANNDWTWHDVFAFAITRYQYETTTDFGNIWTANGLTAQSFKQLTQQKQNVAAVTLTNTSGVANGIRCTFIGLGFSNLGYVMLHMLYSPTVCNIDVIIESSPDNATWTPLFTRANNVLNNSAAGNVFRLNTPLVTTYIRITIVVNTASVAGSTAIFTALRGMALRGGSQGFGKEYEYPYNWTEDKYMRFTVPTYTGTGALPTQYKLALLDTNSGNQLTMTDLGSALNGSFIQNQLTAAQTANFWVTGNGQVGRLYLGTVGVSNSINFLNGANITGAAASYANHTSAFIQSDVTTSAYIYASNISTAAAAFTLNDLIHFRVGQGTIGAGSIISNQTGFSATSTLIGATNNYGFRGQIPLATGRWNLYMDGTASNYIAGRLGIGSTALTNVIFRNSLAITGNTTSYSAFFDTPILSDVTSAAVIYASSPYTQTAAFTLTSLVHYQANQGTIGVGSIVTNQIGYQVTAGLVGATNNYGFRGQIPSGTSNWNLHMDGSAQNYFAGNVSIGINASSTNILNVNIGTVTGATVLGNFSQNGGSIQLQNGTNVASQFTPVFKGVALGNNSYGLGLIAQGFDTYSQAAVVLSARNTSGTNIVTSGKILSVQNYTTEYFSVNYLGVISVPNLAGTGTRIVTADTLGNLSSVALTSGTVTNVSGTSNRITVTNGTTTPVIDIASTYVGQTSITTLGAITNGTWNGAVIGAAYGGTGTNALTGIAVGNGTGAMTGVAGTASQLLRRNAANTGYEFFTPTYLTATPNLQAVATAGNAFLGDLVLGLAGSTINIGSGPAGSGNTRMGTNTLNSNVNGDWNVAVGFNALSVMTTSVNNTAIGENTGTSYTGVGSIGNNTWIGNSCGQGMTGGTNNLMVGILAGFVGSTDRNRGDGNIMIGRNAGDSTGTPGSGALGSYNIFMGFNAGAGSIYGPLSNRLAIGNALNSSTDLPIIEGNMTVGAAALTVNASFKATGPAFLISGTNTNSILPATGNDLDIQNNSGKTNIYGEVRLKATPASAGEEMLVVDIAGKIGTAPIPGFAPLGNVSFTSPTNIIVSDASGSTEKYGSIRIETSDTSPQYDVVVGIRYDVPYSGDAKATFNYSNGEIASSMMLGGSNFYYIIDNNASGFSIFFKEIPSKVPFMIDYNVVGY